MPLRPDIPERTPIDHVEVEYDRTSARRRAHRPRFNRARLLNISEDSLELAARESFPHHEKLTLSMHVRGVRDFAKFDGVVERCVRIIVLKQPAFSVSVRLDRLNDDQAKKLVWAREQFVPKVRPAGPVRREPETPPPGPATAQPAAVPAATAQRTAVREARPSQPRVEQVQRPVALLELIERLDRFEVSEDLIMAVLEAAEAGMDVEVLYPKETEVEQAEAEELPSVAPPPVEGQARPINVYRLAGNTRLHFSDKGLPVGPAAELLYLSRLSSQETCFAVQLGVDGMTQQSLPSFKRNSILVFSRSEPVENGDFAFVKTRAGDEFGQVFFEDNNEMRIRPLNPRYRSRVVRRREVQVLCKLIGCYQDAP